MNKRIKFSEEAVVTAFSRYSAVFVREDGEEVCSNCALEDVDLLINVRELDAEIFSCSCCGQDVIPGDHDFYYDFHMEGYPEGLPIFERGEIPGSYCIRCSDEALAKRLRESMASSSLIPFEISMSGDIVCFVFDGEASGGEDVLKARIAANWLYSKVIDKE